ncbi:MAG: glycosyltransferase family 39 protein [Nanoarchaeota archaeon]
MEESENKKPIDRSIDFLFSNYYFILLIGIFLFGAILRFIVVTNVGLVADEPVHAMHAIGTVALNPLSTLSQSPLWFYITDIAYIIFGINWFSARFLSFFFGSLSIIAVFLLGSVMFNRKVGILAAFILAVSSYHIVWAAAYMDEGMMFFILLAMYLFVKEYKDKKTISLWSALFLGVALLVKIIAAVFIVIFGIFILGILYRDYKSDKKRFKSNLKRAFFFGLILFVCFLPPLVYNYFIYKNKGIVDLPFALYFGINREYYQGQGLAHETGFNPGYMWHSIKTMLFGAFWKFDPIMSFLALLGLFFLWKEYKKKKFEVGFCTIMFVFSALFICLSVELPNHYTNILPFLAILGALFLVNASSWLKKPLIGKQVIIGICLILLIFNIAHMWGSISSQSGYEKLRQHTIDSIDKGDLVIVDSRIYRGVTAWTFNDRHYIESSLLSELIAVSEQQPGERVKFPVTFVECVLDDCGWGNVYLNPSLNSSSEEMVSLFRNISHEKKSIYGGGSSRGIKGNEKKGELVFNVYSTELLLNPSVTAIAEQTHEFFFYPVRRNLRPEASFDYYEVNGLFDNLLNILAYIVLYILLALALATGIIIWYILVIDLKAT